MFYIDFLYGYYFSLIFKKQNMQENFERKEQECFSMSLELNTDPCPNETSTYLQCHGAILCMRVELKLTENVSPKPQQKRTLNMCLLSVSLCANAYVNLLALCTLLLIRQGIGVKVNFLKQV